MLLVEHNVRLVMEVCDRITVLHFGQVIAEGPRRGGPRPGGLGRLPGERRVEPRPTAAPLLEVVDLHVAYGPVQAVRGASLRVAEGDRDPHRPQRSRQELPPLALAGFGPPAPAAPGWAEWTSPSPRLIGRWRGGVGTRPRGDAILGRMTIEENLFWPASSAGPPGPGQGPAEQYRRLPGAGRAATQSWREPCRAGSSRCWRWPARS